MILLQSVQKNLGELGIQSDRPFQTHPFNRKNVLISISNVLCVVLHALYLFRVAHTYKEYMISFYMTTAVSVVFVVLSTLIWKSKKLFRLFEAVTEIVNESESRIYESNVATFTVL